MPTDAPPGRQDGDPDFSDLEPGDTVTVDVTHNTTPDRAVTGDVTRTTRFGGGTTVKLTDADSGDRVTVYGDFYPPIVEQAGYPDGRAERVRRTGQ